MCISASVIMNLWLCFFVLFVVGSTSAKSITYHNVTLSSNYTISAEDLLKNVSKAVVEFDKNLDKYIDWVSLDNMFEEMLEHSGQLNIGSIGDVRKLLLKSRELYFQAVARVYGWCGEIDVLMTAYRGFLDVYEEGVEDAQKEIINNSLESGVMKMQESLGNLDKSFSDRSCLKSRVHLNSGIVEISNVMSNISEAFKNDQSEHDNKLHQLNQGAIESLGKIAYLLLAESQNVRYLQATALGSMLFMGFEKNVGKIAEPVAATYLINKCHCYQVKHGLKV